MTNSAADRIFLLGSLAVVIILWIVHGTLLGALGAVLRFWLFFFLLALAVGTLRSTAVRASPRITIIALAIAALLLEIGFEVYIPSVLPGSLDEPGICYDKQGPYRC